MQALLSEELIPPVINITINDELVDAMKCLNMLGTFSACHWLKLCMLICQSIIDCDHAVLVIIIRLNDLIIFLEGILWAGRGQVRKSLLYLLSVKNMYQSAFESSYNRCLLKKTFWAEIDSIYTHNLFYLAQAYGNNNFE